MEIGTLVVITFVIYFLFNTVQGVAIAYIQTKKKERMEFLEMHLRFIERQNGLFLDERSKSRELT